MRQNFGLFLLTLGSVILSFCVLPGRLVGKWKDLTWEQRLALKMVGGSAVFGGKEKRDEYMNHMATDEKFRKREMRRTKWRTRIDNDLPLIAMALIVAGFFLCLNYAAF